MVLVQWCLSNGVRPVACDFDPLIGQCPRRGKRALGRNMWASKGKYQWETLCSSIRFARRPDLNVFREKSGLRNVVRNQRFQRLWSSSFFSSNFNPDKGQIRFEMFGGAASVGNRNERPDCGTSTIGASSSRKGRDAFGMACSYSKERSLDVAS